MLSKITQLTSHSEELEDEFEITSAQPAQRLFLFTEDMSLATNFTLPDHLSVQEPIKTPSKDNPSSSPPILAS